eukprot:gene11915-8197_t
MEQPFSNTYTAINPLPPQAGSGAVLSPEGSQSGPGAGVGVGGGRLAHVPAPLAPSAFVTTNEQMTATLETAPNSTTAAIMPLGRHHPSVVERNVYVASLPQHYDYNQLEQLFAPIGPIEQRTLKFEDSRCKGYGFVLFQRKEDAQEAVRRMHGAVVDGTRIQVRLARQEATMKAVLPPQVAPTPTMGKLTPPPPSFSFMDLSNSLSSPNASPTAISFTNNNNNNNNNNKLDPGFPQNSSANMNGIPPTPNSNAASAMFLGSGMYSTPTPSIYTGGPAPVYSGPLGSAPTPTMSSSASPVRSPVMLPPCGGSPPTSFHGTIVAQPSTNSNAATSAAAGAPAGMYYLYDVNGAAYGIPASSFTPAPSSGNMQYATTPAPMNMFQPHQGFVPAPQDVQPMGQQQHQQPQQQLLIQQFR